MKNFDSTAKEIYRSKPKTLSVDVFKAVLTVSVDELYAKDTGELSGFQVNHELTDDWGGPVSVVSFWVGSQRELKTNLKKIAEAYNQAALQIDLMEL